MLTVREAIVVEGKYDKERLSEVVDALIVPVGGFRLFRDKETMAMLRTLAAARGLLILTDSDAAGMVIRNKLASCIPPSQIRHAYIPPIPGKEKRKSAPSKEGLIGVEGMDAAVIEQAIRRSGATIENAPASARAGVTSERMMADGLSGGPNSAALRRLMLRRLGLPAYLSAKRLREYIDRTMTASAYRAALCQVKEEFEKSLDMDEA